MPGRQRNRPDLSLSAVAAAEQRVDEAVAQPQKRHVAGDLSWQAHAACADRDPDMFHPDKDATAITAAAIDVCISKCTVIEACRARRYELGAGGVWGGVLYRRDTGLARRCATKDCGRVVQSMKAHYCGFEHERASKIGTRAGYQLHMRAKVPVCVSCSEGYHDESRKYRSPDAVDRGWQGASLVAISPGAHGSLGRVTDNQKLHRTPARTDEGKARVQ
jgi:hypothetical protein